MSKSNLATDVENCFSLKSFNRSLQLLIPPSSTIIIFGDDKSKVLFSNIVCIASPTSAVELKQTNCNTKKKKDEEQVEIQTNLC